MSLTVAQMWLCACLGLLSVASVVYLYFQTRKWAKREDLDTSAHSVIFYCVVLPALIVVLFVGAGMEENVLAFIFSSIFLSVVTVELVTLGRPLKLVMWFNGLEDKRWMLPIGEEAHDYNGITKAQRPYRKFFWIWLALVPANFIGALFLGFAVLEV